ncbi:uncharacterized protein N7498_010614 [Penicillium cinerascens]|uniref:Uncharacterized protein n=1 Tax=Penicillium cinerascens TaxID=70096 RepID=A0A9W9J8B0_9EURO|nr:uncharacterized protein N7498_010614 [Penicillium cinerascens]KAJ5191629.1 hypothetical protein N7498_010614 [Penicillium cinerascens]
MGWFSDSSDQASAYDQLLNTPDRAKLPDELIAAAASYEAAKAYENHCAENGKLTIRGIKATRVTCAGKPGSHAEAKELLGAVAGAFIDRIVETKGKTTRMPTT